jgi:hypothetical protein
MERAAAMPALCNELQGMGEMGRRFGIELDLNSGAPIKRTES